MGAAILFTSLQLLLAEPYHVVRCKWPLDTTWYGRCHLVSGGPGCVWLAEPYHVVPLESSATPKHGIWDNIASFFYTIQTPICYVGHGHISPYTSGIPLSWKTKKQFVFFRINLWTPVTFTFKPRKLSKLTNRRHLYWVCVNIILKFQSHLKVILKTIWLCDTSLFMDM